jgi:hypothetical protein
MVLTSIECPFYWQQLDILLKEAQKLDRKWVNARKLKNLDRWKESVHFSRKYRPVAVIFANRS